MGGQDLLVLLCGAWLEVTVRQPPRRVRVEAGARDPGGAGVPQPAVDLTPAVDEPCLSIGSFREGVLRGGLAQEADLQRARYGRRRLPCRWAGWPNRRGGRAAILFLARSSPL